MEKMLIGRDSKIHILPNTFDPVMQPGKQRTQNASRKRSRFVCWGCGFLKPRPGPCPKCGARPRFKKLP